MKRFLVAVLLLVPSLPLFAQEAESMPRCPDLELVDLDGRRHQLPPRGERPLVLAWLVLDCPLSRVYLPRLLEMAAAAGETGPRFLLIASSRQDSELELRTHAGLATTTAAVVRDVDARAARAFGVTRSTEVLVIDGKGGIRYRGAVDDQYGYRKNAEGRADTYAQDEPRTRHLADALAALAAGADPAPARTDPLGCALELDWRDGETRVGAPTFHEDVQPLLLRHCGDCHRPGGAAPFPLQTFADVGGWTEMIAEVVRDGTMPPWNANPAHGTFANARVLSDAEKKLVLDWVAAGAPRGDAAAAPPVPAPLEGWAIGEPDVVLELDEQEIPATGKLDYRYVQLRTGFPEDRWIEAFQVRSTSPEVVHHVLGFVKQERRRSRDAAGPWFPTFDWTALVSNVPVEERMPYLQRLMRVLEGTSSRKVRGGAGLDGYLLAELPGSGPMIHPRGRAQYLPADATLIFQLHYTPNGTATTSRTSIALRFAAEPPQEVVDTRAIATIAFRVPPRARDHVVEASYVLPRGATLLSLQPHMHLRGSAFRYVAVDPATGAQEILLDVPSYDFDWQHEYVLAQPKRLEKGTVLRGIARFDNGVDNPGNPDPDAEVYFGLQTDEEMMIGYFRAIWDRDDLATTSPPESEPTAPARSGPKSPAGAGAGSAPEPR